MNRETAILQLLSAKGMGAKSIGKLLKRLASEGYPVEEFVETPLSQMTEDYKLSADCATGIKEAQPDSAALAEELAARDVTLLDISSDDYPSGLQNTLQADAPPLLFCWGNLDLLHAPSIGFCGSRKASEQGMTFAGQCAEALASKDINVVSGYADGIDTAAHYGALSSGGTTTLVIATGILSFSTKASLKDLFNESSCLVVSEFSPRLGWFAANAMQRNRTIVGLSGAVVLVESGTTGGTFDAGKAALKYQVPLFVLDDERETESVAGNRYFLKNGAIPLVPGDRDRSLAVKLSNAMLQGTNRAIQRSLFDSNS